jgi:hypothetical protein
VVSTCRIWCLAFKLSVWCGAEGCVSGLRVAAIKIHVLHLVGIIFLHIIDDARSKPHQKSVRIFAFTLLGITQSVILNF